MSLSRKEAATTAQVISRALPYIQRFAGKTVVVKYVVMQWWTKVLSRVLLETLF